MCGDAARLSAAGGGLAGSASRVSLCAAGSQWRPSPLTGRIGRDCPTPRACARRARVGRTLGTQARVEKTYRTGDRGHGSGNACGRSRRKPLWRTCSSANTASRSLIGPQGTPDGFDPQSTDVSGEAGLVLDQGHERLAVRDARGLVANRSSSATPDIPPIRRSGETWVSSPTARMKWPSDVGKAW